MDNQPRNARRRVARFGLRRLFLLVAVCCVLAYLDPLDWRSRFAPPAPFKRVPFGEDAVVDLIELNHRPLSPAEIRASGQKGFDQLLFWSFHPDGKLHVRAWRLVKSPSMLPMREDGQWVCRWEESGQTCCVRAFRFRETTAFTPDDPEILDRDELPKHLRVNLWHAAPAK